MEFFSKTFQNPYANEFDLAIQQALGANTVLSVSYLGALGRELPNFINTNLTNDTAHTYTFNYKVGAGSNGSCGGSYLCTGKVGYDGPSGLGTPNGSSAF